MIDAIKQTLEKKGISTIVIASRGGKSAIKLAESLGKKIQVIGVSEFSYKDSVKKKMKKRKVVAVENADLVIQDVKKSRDALNKLGSGVKAAVEVALIARKGDLVEDDFVAVSGLRDGDIALIVNGERLESEVFSVPIDEEKVEQYVSSVMIT